MNAVMEGGACTAMSTRFVSHFHFSSLTILFTDNSDKGKYIQPREKLSRTRRYSLSKNIMAFVLIRSILNFKVTSVTTSPLRLCSIQLLQKDSEAGILPLVEFKEMV